MVHLEQAWPENVLDISVEELINDYVVKLIRHRIPPVIVAIKRDTGEVTDEDAIPFLLGAPLVCAKFWPSLVLLPGGEICSATR